MPEGSSGCLSSLALLEEAALTGQLLVGHQLAQERRELVGRFVIGGVHHKHLEHVVDALERQAAVKVGEHAHHKLLVHRHILHSTHRTSHSRMVPRIQINSANACVWLALLLHALCIEGAFK